MKRSLPYLRYASGIDSTGILFSTFSRIIRLDEQFVEHIIRSIFNLTKIHSKYHFYIN